MVRFTGVGRAIKHILSKNEIRPQVGCQQSQVFEYMDRIGVQGCEERFDNLVQSLLNDTKNWRRKDKPINKPSEYVIREFLQWAIEIVKIQKSSPGVAAGLEGRPVEG